MTGISERLRSLSDEQKKNSASFRPVLYRLSDAQDLKEFTKLLSNPGIFVVDHIFEQISEYVKLQSPDHRFSTEDLKLETEKHIGKTDLNEYGVWAYYPWSNRLVHILDKEEFIDVRTSRNQYKITREERDTLAKKRIGIIGLSVGQSVSVTLAMERICGELRLADFDLLELTNLNRIRTGVHNLGLPKVYSVAREVSEIDPYIHVICYPEGLHENNLHDFFMKDGKLDLLVEESDGFDIKILSRYKARELGVPVIMEASDKCMVDVERFDLEPDRKILHGIVKHLDVNTLKSLKTNEEKIPYMLDVLGLSSTSARLRASMLEMQQTISTWPQLGSAVTMGGGITADVSRRILLNHFTDSGRYYVDIDELIGDKSTKEVKAVSPTANNPSLSSEQMLTAVSSLKSNAVSDISEDDLLKVVEAAAVAPSYANKQPWKWLSFNKQLALFKDYVPGPHDPFEEQAFVSLGAAIQNAVLKSNELGYEVSIETQPVKSEKELVAVISFKRDEARRKDAKVLSSQIFERHTNRQAGNSKSLRPEYLQELNDVVKDAKSGSSLTIVSSREAVEGVAKANGVAERIRLLHPALHEDYFRNEIRWSSGQPITEGIDVNTLGYAPPVMTAFEVISDPKVATLLQQWEKGSAFEKLNRQIVASSSAIGLISVSDNSVTSLLEAGRLAEKIWLTCTKNSLAFQPICVPLILLKLSGSKNGNQHFSTKTFSEIKALKDQLSLIFRELESREAVFLFRVFEADRPSSYSLRKPLSEVYFKR